MAIREISETKIPDTYSTVLYSEHGYDVAREHTVKILDTLVEGTTRALAAIKSQDFPVAFVFEEPNKDFICAAVLQYIPNEDDASQPGSWNYSWTFNKEDVPENARVCTPYDVELASFYRTVCHAKWAMGFDTVEGMADVFRYLLEIIVKYLDENASETEVNEIKMSGVITFRVAVEDGEKVMSAEPDGEIKQLVKDDARIEA